MPAGWSAKLGAAAGVGGAAERAGADARQADARDPRPLAAFSTETVSVPWVGSSDPVGGETMPWIATGARDPMLGQVTVEETLT